MLSYLLELTICWGLLYSLYAFFLSTETFFKINRTYLIFALLAGIFIPLLELPVPSTEVAENAVVYLQTIVVVGMETVENSAQQTQVSSSIGLVDILLGLYFAGALMLSLRFLYGLFQIKQLYSVSEKKIYQGKKMVLTPKNHTPFSFLNFLFIPNDLDLKNPDNQKIIEHEYAHLSQRHTIDVLLLEVLSIVFWCVPPIYFFKHSIRQIHEYLADAEVLKNTKKKQYGLLLLRQSHQGRMCLSLANHFNQSQLKKRIMMMTKKPSDSRALWKYLAALPLCFLLVFAFANRGDKAELSIFSLSQNDFDAVKIKTELQKIVTFFNADASNEIKEEGLKKFIQRFDELMIEHPNHRDEIKLITEDVTNEKGIAIAIVRAEHTKDLYSVVSLDVGKNDPICKDADEYPRFPGCEDKSGEERKECAQHKMLMFIYTKIKYPQEARDKDIQGTVVSSFVVGADGEIRDAKIVREVGGGCDEAVLEIIAQMPKWIPGKKDGKNVAVAYKLPVKFKLEGEKQEEKKQEETLESKLNLKDFSIAPNPNSGTFRARFLAEKKPIQISVTDAQSKILYSREIEDFSGVFDEEITVKAIEGIVYLTVMQGGLQHTEKITITK